MKKNFFCSKDNYICLNNLMEFGINFLVFFWIYAFLYGKYGCMEHIFNPSIIKNYFIFKFHQNIIQIINLISFLRHEMGYNLNNIIILLLGIP